jgi:nitric oxide reductase subunit B
VAGVLQAYLERILGMGYMAAQEQMRFWFEVTFYCGIAFLVGVLVTVYDLFFLKPKEEGNVRREAIAPTAS